MTKEENLDNLIYQLTELGFPRTALYEYLDSCFGMERIPYDYRKRTGDDLISYHLTIGQDTASGSYMPEGYQATLLQTHPIQHARIDGIDTFKLEQRLKAIDWNSYIPKNNEVGGDMFRAIIDVVNLSLSGTKGAADISRRLQLRHWLGTPVGQDLNVSSHIDDYQKSHYFQLKNDLTDVSTAEAYNLLSGRAVMKFRQVEDQQGDFKAEWKELSDGKLKPLPDYDFMAILKALPVPEAHSETTGSKLVYDLIKGDRVAVTFEENGKSSPVYLEANPRERTISVFDRNMIRLYPEALRSQTNRKLLNPKQAPAKKSPGKNKGRSI